MHEKEFMVIVIGILSGMGLCCVLVRHVSWVIRAWFETALKRDMVARGYTSQEIISVIKADRKCDWRNAYGDVPPAKPIRQPAYSP